ncbi:MAG: DEAD/DEAH box helicase [Desulfovibrio sp.]|nr:DEAD/DEAH box helicase [Desulfovibrio sp.]
MSVAQYVQTVLQASELRQQITDHRILPAKAAQYAAPRNPWPRAIQNLLDERDIRLYSHQSLATDHIRAGHSIVVSTPTASGKSLIYTLPVLEQCLLDCDAHALFLFPLKALAQDQLQSFRQMTHRWPKEAQPTAALYDGDTPDNERRKIRRNPPRVLITNPEMLHLGILPWHEQWTSFLAGLRTIVVDEAHTYRGIFGSNMAQVFRRLNRIVRRYGVDPSYVLCTATVGNPGELASLLTGQSPSPVVIDASGAPQGARHFIFIDPVLSPSTVAIDLLKLALARNLRTIVYCQSRKMTELISLWASHSASAEQKKHISAYRAGFLPEERRQIEAKMASGELRCIVTTSALELGIDIGGLDVCILVGYPGTVMSTLQRGGRVGRSSQESVVILLAAENALDQYFIHNPDDFFSRSPEKAVLNPENEIIAERHLECAAHELPLANSEAWLTSVGEQRALKHLIAMGRLLPSKDGQSFLSLRKNPQRDISLRSGGQSCLIEDQNGQLIGSLDTYRAWHEAHPGAVYLHHGHTYLVQSLDPARGRIVVHEDKVPWFTRVRAQKSTSILEEYQRQGLGRCLVCRGRLRITDHVTGYERRSNSGNRLLDFTNLDVPPQIFETEGLWYIIPESIRLSMEEQFFHFMGSIHAMEHAIIGLLPLQVMADRNDFGGISTPLHPQLGLSCVFIYDGVPGGCGLTREAFGNARAILEDTCKVISRCQCFDGCPSCVHSPKCGSGNRPISKKGAIELLHELLAEGNDGDVLAQTLSLSCPPSDFQPWPPVPQPTAMDKNSVAEPPSKPQIPPKHYLVFDVETRRSAKDVGGWNYPEKMGISVCVAYDSLEDRFLRFEQDELAELFRRFGEAELVIGFNSLRFDYRVLQPFSSFDLMQLPSLDLLKEVYDRLHYRISLDALARCTLEAQKSADGLQALTWWKEGQIDKIAQYCEQDVRITRDLYLYGLNHGHLYFSAKSGQKVRLDVNFSWPKNKEAF